MNEQSKLSQDNLGTGHDQADRCTITADEWLKKDTRDPLGDWVDRILVGTDRFIIYSVVQDVDGNNDSEGQDASNRSRQFRGRGADHVWLRTKYPQDYDCAKALRSKLGGIASELAYVCDVVDSICRSGSLDEGSSASLRRRAAEMMARAMEMAYEGNGPKALELLKSVRTNVTTMRDSRNRMRYVQGNLIALCCILILWLVFRFVDLTSPLVISGGAEAFDVHALDILALGAIGAFFAVSASVSSIRVDHAVSFWEMVYSGFVRIPIGVIAAGVAIFLISGDWLLASIEPSIKPWTYLLFGFLAGFSELFVPNALRQVEAASTASAPATETRPNV